MTVTTDSPAGYTVSVQAGGNGLLPALPGDTDTNPLDDLQVRDSAAAFQALSAGAPVVVFSRSARSPPGGQPISTDIG